MNCKDIMNVLSQCGLGALLLKNHRILEINESGDRLLLGDGTLVGKDLTEIAPELCKPIESSCYDRIAFGKYISRCQAPSVDDLPFGTELIVFRDSTDAVHRDMLLSVVNQSAEGVILCDEDSRICLLNDAAVKMDSIVALR